MSASGKDNPAHEVFVVLDLDRTLIDSSLLTSYLVEYYVPLDNREEEVAAIARHRGSSYDALTYLGTKYSLTEPIDAGTLVERHGWKTLADALLLPGAAEIFFALDSRRVPYGIFTKGGKAFQSLKVALLCAMVGETAIPYQVTNTNEKAAYIAKHWWSDARGVFVIPEQLSGTKDFTARRVIIVDDKLDNLASTHHGITPYHISVNTVQTFIDSIDDVI